MLGLTRWQLGRAAGLTRNQVQRYELALNLMDPEKLHVFASLLGVSVDYFFEEKHLSMRSVPRQARSGRGSFTLETSSLIHNYYCIDNANIRAAILYLLKALSRER